MRYQLIPLALGAGAIANSVMAAGLPLELKPAYALTPAGAKARAPVLAPPAGLVLRLAEALSMPARRLPSAEPTHAALLGQARLWQSRNRDDLAAEALNKLLSIWPDHPDAVAQFGFLQMRANRKGEAKQTLDRLRRLRPDHPDILRLETLIRLDEGDRDRLRQARMLAHAGRPEEALVKLRELYPAGPPTGDLALEYWLLVGDTRNGWERALAGLEHLVAEYPDNLRYRLALAEHVTSRRPADAAALKTISELARHPQFERQARAAWRRAMLRLEPAPPSIALIEAYLSHEKTEDVAVKEHLAGIRVAIEQRRRLLADPFYRARLDGLALLDGGKLDDADAKLSHALAGRPDDPEVLGGMGLIRLRQGHHAEAQAYFQQACQRDRNNRRWDNLLRTARFWGLMREAGDALDAGEHSLAAAKLEEARLLDARAPAAALALARVRVAQGKTAEAEAAFREALALEPDNAGAITGLALHYLRSGREQELGNLLAKTAAAQRQEVSAAIAAARAAIYKEQGEALLARGEARQAIALLERAAEYDLDDPWLRYDLARLYAAQGAHPKGEALFAALLARRPDDAAARYAHALLLSGQDQPVAALTTLERIAAAERNAGMTALQRRLWVRLVIQKALASKNRPAAAQRLLDDAQRQVAGDSELMLDLANARLDIGDPGQAHAMLLRLMETEPPSVDWSLRHARLLAAAGGDDVVPSLIERIAAMHLNAEQRQALDELRIDITLRRAHALRRDDRLQEALRILAVRRREYPQHEGLLAAEARFLRASGRPDLAHDNYRRILELHPQNKDAAIARIEVLVELRRLDEARSLAEAQLAALDGATPDQTADLIGILLDLQEEGRVAQLIETALAAAPDHPRTLAYAGQLARRQGRIDEAIGLLQRALAAEMAQNRRTVAPGVSVLRVAQSPDGSAPPALDIRSAPAGAIAAEANAGGNFRRMADWIDQGTTWLSSAMDRRSRSGSSGTSEYALTEVPVEWKQPAAREGRWTYRADLVTVRASSLDLAASAATFGSALLCQPSCNSGLLSQSASGIALNAALEREGTRYDIGTTPLGFPVQTITGGILHKGDLGPFGYSIDVSRRPLTGSLLSYAGTRDPRTGQVWGGVQANGVRFGLSLDNGGTYGGWSSLGLHRLSGRNVSDNNRMQWMAGGVLRLINEDDRQLQFGLTGMHWRMSENAGEYTFGHGGYYSPVRYSSLSLPVTFGQRDARLSYSVRAALSVSRSQTASAPYFPTDSAMQAQAERRSGITGVSPFYSGGPGRGVGRSLALTGEYQAVPRLFLGTRLELERSPDYAPNRFVVYLRFAVDRQPAGPVAFLPEPLNPTSQY